MMRRTEFMSSVLAVFFAAGAAVAQSAGSNEIEGPQAFLANGVCLRFSTIAVPPVPHRTVSTMVSVDSDILHRVFVDKRSGRYFGYDLQFERVSGSALVRVAVTPLSAEFRQNLERDAIYRVHFGNSLRPLIHVPLANYPAPQFAEDRDVIKLDLVGNVQAGARLSDMIAISMRTAAELQSQTVGESPRDFGLEDVQLRMGGFRLFIDNELFSEGSGAGYSGSILWFYAPGHGRFAFSILPRAGFDFQRIGVIDGNKILFSANGHTYEWVSALPIIGPRGRWNAWVLCDNTYRLTDRDTSSSIRRPSDSALSGARVTRGIVSGAADSPADLIQNN